MQLRERAGDPQSKPLGIDLQFLVLQDPTTLNDGSAGGYVAGQIFYDVFHKRFGSGGGGVVALIIPGVAMLLCGMASLTSNSR